MNFGKHCDLCENQKTNFHKGTTCNLTGSKPSFDIICPDIKLEEKLKQRLDLVNITIRINELKKVQLISFLCFHYNWLLFDYRRCFNFKIYSS
jgi:hypothetical protein